MQLRNLPCKFGSYLALLHHLKQMPLDSTPTRRSKRSSSRGTIAADYYAAARSIFALGPRACVFWRGLRGSLLWLFALLRLRARAVAQRTNFAALMHAIGASVSPQLWQISRLIKLFSRCSLTRRRAPCAQGWVHPARETATEALGKKRKTWGKRIARKRQERNFAFFSPWSDIKKIFDVLARPEIFIVIISFERHAYSKYIQSNSEKQFQRARMRCVHYLWLSLWDWFFVH